VKIFQVVTLSELGGAQTVVANLSNALVGAGHQVIVIAGEGDGKLFCLLDENIKHIKIESLKHNISLLNEIKTINIFRKLYKQYKPDIIQLHSSKAGILGRIAFPAKKIVYTVHGFDSIRLVYRKYLPFERLLQYKCKAIVGVSNYDVVNLRREKITHNVICIYNGI
jgi:glycosyltransferase involved in cell wall biosynthesis